MSELNFNAAEIEPQTSFEPIPAGEYTAMITDSELKDTKNGTGKYLQLSFQILDGPYKNRIVFDRLNIFNVNPTAQEIGQRALSALCHATGVLQVSDSAQLHNIPVIIKVAVRPSDQYGDSNEVKSYKSIKGGQAPVHKQPSASAPALPANKPAWVK